MKCEKCGKEYDEEVKFCSECGNNLQLANEVSESVGGDSEGEVDFEGIERINVKKKDIKKILLYLIPVIIILILLLTFAFSCKHEYRNATCSYPKTCSLCGKEKGKALGHSWVDATCENPQTCERCEKRSGAALGHEWNNATCTDPKNCKRCGKTDGEPLGHTVDDWTVAEASTCTVKGFKTGNCKVCSDTIEENMPLAEHNFGEWQTVKKATCKEKGSKKRVCGVCAHEENEEIKLANHTYGEWKITKTATIDSEGEKTQTCSVCGDVNKIEYKISEAEYKAACKEYSYEEIARNPNSFKGKNGSFYGKVIQVMETDIVGYTSYTLRVAIDGDYDSVFLVSYFADKNEDHILEDDYITMYGVIKGTKSYETVMGSTVTIPYLDAEVIVIE